MFIVRAHKGFVVRGKALAWTGLGNAPDVGLGVSSYWFVQDWLAIGAAVSPTRFNPAGPATLGVEVEGASRGYVFQSPDLGLFLDLKGGYLATKRGTPPGGTRDNWTFAFGPGFEVPLGHRFSFVGGAEFHHLSNAKGRDTPRNPSQNEVRSWIGFGLTF